MAKVLLRRPSTLHNESDDLEQDAERWKFVQAVTPSHRPHFPTHPPKALPGTAKVNPAAHKQCVEAQVTPAAHKESPEAAPLSL